MKLLNLYFENKTSTNSVNQVLVKFCLPTVGRRPTLSAGYKIPLLRPVGVILQPQPITDLVKKSFFLWKHASLGV